MRTRLRRRRTTADNLPVPSTVELLHSLCDLGLTPHQIRSFTGGEPLDHPIQLSNAVRALCILRDKFGQPRHLQVFFHSKSCGGHTIPQLIELNELDELYIMLESYRIGRRHA